MASTKTKFLFQIAYLTKPISLNDGKSNPHQKLDFGYHKKKFFGNQISDAESKPKRATSTSPLCTQCKSARVWKDGSRYTALAPVQRYVCCSCEYWFSVFLVKQILNKFREPSKAQMRLDMFSEF